MNFLRRNIFVLMIFTFLPIDGWAQTASSLEQKADLLYDHYQDQQALELYAKVLEDEPQNYQALWRTSFLYSRVGNRFEDKGQ